MIADAMERACARIAPTWPLDRFIAVNPFWEMVDAPLTEVSARLTALSGARLLMPRAWYREQWESGRLTDRDLADAIAEAGTSATVAELHALMRAPEPDKLRRARVMDVLDAERDLGREMSWRDFVVHGTSQFCASYFDEGQARIEPEREGGLYASWRRQAVFDRSPVLLMGQGSYPNLAGELPRTASEMAEVALAALDVPVAERDAYLTGLLLDLNGWAAWCAYRRWTAKLAGGDDDAIAELLSIRLAWEWLLLRSGGSPLLARWRSAMAAWPAIDANAHASQRLDWLLQRGVEIAFQRDLGGRLRDRTPEPSRTSVQVAFCIDVRSEPFRRALEAAAPEVETLGFAGFFGMPVAYRPVAAASARPQLPGLLAPRLAVTDSGVPEGLASRRSSRLAVAGAWNRLKTGAATSFVFVESVGLLASGKLLADAFGWGGRPSAERAGLTHDEHALRKPRLTERVDGAPLALEERCALAEGILRAMSLTRDFARLVVLLGHGSQTRNNPHAAGLDCGACCGQTGEVNARAAAALLNEPEVRSSLAAHGIVVPDATRFVAGLHDTTTDEVTLYDEDEVAATHGADIAALRTRLGAATRVARRERAPRLGLAGVSDAALHRAVHGRAGDWAEVRPEWGLANNAAFVVAPRSRTRLLDLAGRAFLHDYRFEDDEDFRILELIMTAPMVVTHWINLQYYASTVDNVRYGSGNKVLHNVVGGHLGVFEGNGGDLRIGLPLQSLHDGERWVHTPLRLSVYVEAPCAAIEGVLRKHDKVRDLVDNGWLHLFQLEAGTLRGYRQGGWA